MKSHKKKIYIRPQLEDIILGDELLEGVGPNPNRSPIVYPTAKPRNVFPVNDSDWGWDNSDEAAGDNSDVTAVGYKSSRWDE